MKKRKRGIRYYQHQIFGRGGIFVISKKDILSEYPDRFFTAFDIKLIHELTKKVKTACVEGIWAEVILSQIGRWCTFQIGDPLEFRGKVIGTVKIGDQEYIKIMISKKESVYFYCRISFGYCHHVKLVS